MTQAKEAKESGEEPFSEANAVQSQLSPVRYAATLLSLGAGSAVAPCARASLRCSACGFDVARTAAVPRHSACLAYFGTFWHILAYLGISWHFLAFVIARILFRRRLGDYLPQLRAMRGKILFFHVGRIVKRR